MKKLINLISEEVTKAFVSAGYDEKYGKVTLSNRPDLCEFQYIAVLRQTANILILAHK